MSETSSFLSTLSTSVSTNNSMIYAEPSSTNQNSSPFSINDLLNSKQVILEKEMLDRQLTVSFSDVSIDTLKPNLYVWAGKGFPIAFIVSTLTLNPPSICSDGISRNLIEYFTWITNKTTEQWFECMNCKVSGMCFSYSHNGFDTINLHITKN